MRHVITLTGPCGIGKSYVKRKVKREFVLREPPIYTTRPLRDNEEIGERIRITDDEFDVLVNNQEFLFVNELFGYRYGLRTADIYQTPGDLILELYVDNTGRFRELLPDAHMIAMIPSSIEFIEKRLRKRGDKTIFERLKHAPEEIEKIVKNYKDGIFDVLYVISEKNEGKIVKVICEYIESIGVKRRKE